MIEHVLERRDVPVDQLEPNPANPNKMSNRQFDLLVANIQQVGFTDPVLVRQLPNDRYRIVGGHHRWEAAKYLGMETVPVTVITDPSFDDEMEDMQNLRHNVIKGSLDPQKFFDLYAKYAGKYNDDLIQEMMGFAEAAEFQRLIKKTAAKLPKELKDKFLEAAEEIKTIDGLSKLLNTLFTKFGNTVPYGYMVVDYGGQRSVWLRSSKKTIEALDVVGTLCIEQKRAMDDIVGRVVQLIARGDLKEVVDKIISETPEVAIPKDMSILPTHDNIKKVTSV